MPTDPAQPRDVSGITIVMDAWAAFGTADPARVAAAFTEDAEWIAPPDNASARRMGGVHHFIGREAIVHFVTVLFPQVFTHDVSVTFTGLHDCGDVVIVEEQMTATLANGRRYSNDYCFIFELEGRRIRRVREYMDTQRGERCFSGAML